MPMFNFKPFELRLANDDNAEDIRQWANLPDILEVKLGVYYDKLGREYTQAEVDAYFVELDGSVCV